MLRIVRSRPSTTTNHLDVASAHLKAAIVHINNEAQSQVPLQVGGDGQVADDLRLTVRALSDIITLLNAQGRLAPPLASEPVTSYPATVEHGAVINQRR
jgi:hypothetical protein